MYETHYVHSIYTTWSQAMHLSLDFPFQGLELNTFILKALTLHRSEVWCNLAFKYKLILF